MMRHFTRAGLLYLAVVFALSCSESNDNFTPVDINEVDNRKGDVTLTVAYEPDGKPRLNWDYTTERRSFNFNKAVIYRAEIKTTAKPGTDEALPASARPGAAKPGSPLDGALPASLLGKSAKFMSQDYSTSKPAFKELTRVDGKLKTYKDSSISEDKVYLYRVMLLKGSSYLVSKVDNKASTDKDGDNANDNKDAFPDNPGEQQDNDGDGVGNKADFDDDGDGLLDFVEEEKGTDPTNADSDGDGASDSQDLVQGASEPLSLREVVPPKGFSSGGTNVRLIGQNFQKDMRVLFNGNPAKIVDITSDTATVITPKGAAGDATVEIYFGDGTDKIVLAGVFQYYIPAKVSALYFTADGQAKDKPTLSIGQKDVLLCAVVQNLSSGTISLRDSDNNQKIEAKGIRLSFADKEGKTHDAEYTYDLAKAELAEQCKVKGKEKLGVNAVAIDGGAQSIVALAIAISEKASLEKIQSIGSDSLVVRADIDIYGNEESIAIESGKAGFTLSEISEIDYSVKLTPLTELNGKLVPQGGITGDFTISEGQAVSFQVIAKNLGFAPFQGLSAVDPTIQGSSPAGKIEFTKTPPSGTITVSGKSEHIFEWILTAKAGAKGSFTATSNIKGVDVKGKPLAFENKTSAKATVVTAAKIEVQTVDAPAAMNIGQTGGSISAEVANTGEATVSLTGVALYLFDEAGQPVDSSYFSFSTSPTNPKSIAGGSTGAFSGTVAISSKAKAGKFFAGLYVAGVDVNSTKDASDQSFAVLEPFSIQKPAVFKVVSIAVPSTTISQGLDNVPFNIAIQNKGDAPGSLQSATLAFFDSSGANRTEHFSAALKSGNPGSIAGGGTETFGLLVSVGDNAPAGDYRVFASISGKDSVDGSISKDDSKASDISGDFSVIRPAQIEIATIGVSASQASQGQIGIVATIKAKNTGSESIAIDSAALGFTAGTVDKTADYTQIADQANPINLDPSEEGTFKITFAVKDNATTGTIAINPTIAGQGAISGQAISDDLPGQASIAVKKMATLTTDIIFSQKPITEGQKITAKIRVTNSGEVTAQGVEVVPTQLSPSGTGSATYSTGPTPATNTIPGGSFADFEYSYTTTTGNAGKLTFTASTKGTDALSQREVTSANASADIDVQTPAKVDILSVTAGQSQVSRGQTATITMAVKNSGTASLLLDETQFTLKFIDSSNVNRAGDYTVALTNPSTDLTLQGLETKNFIFSVAVSSSATIDTLIGIDGQASGKDVNNSAATSDTAATAKGEWEVKTPAAFVIDNVLITPTLVNQGQSAIAAAMNVTNSGGATAVITTPSLVFKDNNGSDVSSQYTVTASTNNPTTLAGGTKGTLSFTVNVSSTASKGAITIDATITGKDQLSNKSISKTGAALTDNWTVQAPAKLVSTITATPATASEGQTLTITHKVENQGDAAASTVIPGTLILTGSGKATLATGPTPANATIAGGASQNFVYTYTTKAGDAGSLTFSAKAAGTDANSSAAVESTAATSGNVTILSPAAFAIQTVSSTKTKISQGQKSITVTATVKNTGGATGNVSSASLSLKDGSGNNVASDYTITAATGNPTTITGGATETFTYTLEAKSTATLGSVDADLTISGTDANSGGSISDSAADAKHTFTVQTPAKLAIQSVTLSSDTISQGQQSVPIVVSILNSGQAAATINSVPLLFTKDGNSVASQYTVVASSSNPTSVGGGKTESFTYSVSLTQTADKGSIVVDANTTAVDANSGDAANASGALLTDSVTVQSPATLAIQTITTTPDSVVRKQTGISVSVTVKNTGEAKANVASIALAIKDAGGNTRTTDYTITASGGNPTTINGSTTATFTFTTSVADAATLGAMTIDATTSGTDSNSSKAISDSAADTADSWTVIKPAILTPSFSASPTTLSEGQTITLTYSIKNDGDVRANSVAPSSITLAGTGSATLATGPTPASATIDPGQTAQFVYTYTTTTGNAGSLTFTGTATGTDNVLVTSVSADSKTSDALAIQTPAKLNITSVSADPSTITKLTRGQTSVSFKVNVQNQGQASASITAVNIDFATSALADVTTEYSITKVAHKTSIAGGATESFMYTVDVGSTATLGSITIDASATGKDANSNTNISDSDAATKDTIEIQTPPVLDIINVATTSTQVSQSQQSITVTMLAQNTGGADASISSAGLSFKTSSDKTSEYTVTASSGNPATIASGGQGTFTFTVAVKSTATTGSITLDGVIAGTDVNSGSTVQDTSGATTTDTWTVVQQAALAIGTINATKTSVVRAETGLAISVPVSNTGGAKANVSAFSLKFSQGSSDLTSEYTVTASGSNPTSIDSGATGTFSFTVAASSSATTGSVSIDATITATDNNSAASAGDTAADTADSWTVKTPAILAASISVDKSKISEGQSLSVTMKVTNSGQTDALSVTPSSLTVAGTGTATLSSSPSNSTVTAGSSVDFVYTYTTTSTSAGNITFSGSASGTHDILGTSVSTSTATSSSVTIQDPAVIRILSVTTTPSRVSQSQGSINVAMEVSNTGGATANVSASALTFTGSADRTNDYTVTASSSNASTIAGSAQTTLNFTVAVKSTATAGEAITLNGTASGTDANSSGAISDNAADTTDQWLVDTAAALEVLSVAMTPTKISQGQDSVPITVSVKNNGSATALVSQVQLVYTSAAGLTVSSDYTNTAGSSNPTSIAGGATESFTFTTAASSSATAGVITLKANAVGTDQNSTSSASDTSGAKSDTFTVEKPASLDIVSAAFSPTISKASKGQTGLAVVLSIKNPGGVSATTVVPSLKFLDSNGNSKTSQFTITADGSNPTSIAAGDTKSFAFTVDVKSSASSGATTLDASATGVDSNSSKSLSDDGATTTASFTVQSAAVLSITSVDESITNASQGQTGLAFTIKIANTGEATANISANALVFKDAGGNTVTGQYTSTAGSSNPTTIAGGATGSFTYTTVVANGATTGGIAVDATVSGTDANTGSALSDTSATSTGALTIQTPAVLRIDSVATSPTKISQAQDSIAVTMSITNTGEATANIATVALAFADSSSVNKTSEYTVTPSGSNATSLSGGSSATLNFVVKASSSASTGAITLDGSISGTDSNSSSAISDTAATATDTWTVQSAAVFDILSVATTPTTVSRNQTGIAVTVSVKNNGQATASVDSIALGFTRSGSSATDDYTVTASGSNPTSITGSSTASFAFTVAVGSAAGQGAIILDAAVSGKDQNTQKAITDSSATTTATWSVETPANLQITAVSTTPTKVSKGQSGIAVTVSVQNTGTAKATSTAVALSFLNSSSTAITSQFTVTDDGSNPTSINGSATATFSFTVAVKSDAQSGDATILATATGTDNNTSSSLSHAPTNIKDTWTVQSAATLAITTVAIDPTSVSLSQQDFTVTVELSNSGEATANLGTTSLVLKTTAGDVKTSQYTVSASPSNATTIGGGSTATLSFLVDVASNATTGTIRCDATTAGTDANSSSALSDSAADTTDTVLVQSLASLSIGTIATTPTEVTKGQTGISVTMTVTNNGQATATVTASNLALLDSSSIDRTSSDYTITSSGNPSSIAGGATETFTYTVAVKSGAQSGATTIDGTITAKDANSAATANDSSASTTDSWSVKAGATLSITSIATTPAKVSQGQTAIEVLMTVQNTGDVTATINSGALTFKDSGNSDRASDYTVTQDNSITSIAAGGSAVFDFTVVVKSTATTGAITIDGTVTGTDTNSGASTTDSTATTSDSLTVQTPASLQVVSTTTTPTKVSRGQTGISVSVILANNGQAQASSVSPALILKAGTSTVTSNYTITASGSNATTLSGGTQGTFTFTVAAASDATTGSITLDASTTGADANSGSALSASGGTTDSWTMQTPAVFVVDAISTSPIAVNRSQSGIAITMSVSNTGDATANISSSALVFKDSSNVDRSGQYTITPDSLNPTTISGASSATLTFTVAVSSSATKGSISIDGTITGTDANSSTSISDNAANSTDAFTVMSAAVLAIGTISTTPTTVSQGQSGITVSFDVANSGEAQANISSVAPKFATSGGSSQSYTVTASGGNPTFIAGGQTKTFTFTVDIPSDATQAAITLDGTISGSDANSSTSVSDTAATTTDSFTVQSKAALTIVSVDATPTKVSRGQTGVAFTVVAKNDGQASLTMGTAALSFQKTTSGDVDNDYVVTASGSNPSSLAGGEQKSFTFTATASGTATTGTISVFSSFSGTDANTNAAVSVSGTAQKDTFVLQTKAALSIATSLAFTPSSGATTDNQILVKITVTNSGEATATNVDPVDTLTFTTTATLSLDSGPSPSIVSSLLGGASQVFTYTYNATAAGDITAVNGFSVSGTESNTSAALSASKNYTLSSTYTITTGTGRSTADPIALLYTDSELISVGQGQKKIQVSLAFANISKDLFSITDCGIKGFGSSNETALASAKQEAPKQLKAGAQGTCNAIVSVSDNAKPGILRLSGFVTAKNEKTGVSKTFSSVRSMDYFDVGSRAQLVLKTVEADRPVIEPGRRGALVIAVVENQGDSAAFLSSIALSIANSLGEESTPFVSLQAIDTVPLHIDGHSVARLSYVTDAEPAVFSGVPTFKAALGYDDERSGAKRSESSQASALFAFGTHAIRQNETIATSGTAALAIVGSYAVVGDGTFVAVHSLEDASVIQELTLPTASVALWGADVNGDGEEDLLADTGDDILAYIQESGQFSDEPLRLSAHDTTLRGQEGVSVTTSVGTFFLPNAPLGIAEQQYHAEAFGGEDLWFTTSGGDSGDPSLGYESSGELLALSDGEFIDLGIAGSGDELFLNCDDGYLIAGSAQCSLVSADFNVNTLPASACAGATGGQTNSATDFSGDGLSDVVSSTNGALSIALQRDGAFLTRSVYGASEVNALRIVDVDGDGRPDIVALSESGLAIYRNGIVE